MDKRGIRILSLDAKDIFIADQLPNGYEILYRRGEKQGSINTKKFTNVLDESLDLCEIRKAYQKEYRNSRFSFQENGQEYTTRVINVTFRYSNKEYNRVLKNTYVKFGHSLRDLTFDDHICVKDGQLIAIETGQETAHSAGKELLGDWFYWEDGCYRAKANIPTLHTVQELRARLYEHGFCCNGVRYVRYKRSGGSARVGKCLFIDERLYKRMMKWSLCGLRVEDGDQVDLAGLEAHLALPLSSIVGTVSLKPEHFLIIDDYESVFREEVVETRQENGWLVSDEQNVTIKNSIWDGQSLLDTSMFASYPDRGMLLLRNKFFKSACFQCDLQTWFADKKITDVSQLNGFTVAKDIGDIKIITTPNSLKYLKYGTPKEWFAHMDPVFGIVKHEKPTHFFDGRLVQTHYQLLNTLQLSEAEMRAFLQPSLDYLHLLKTDPCVLRYHIKYPENLEFSEIPLVTKNDIIYRLLGVNEAFSKTKFYHDFKSDLTKAYVKNLRCGHVLTGGTYATLFGNPMEMLSQAIGAFDGTSSMERGTIHCKFFSYNKQLLGSRSPHVTIGNIWMPVNREYPELDRYFRLSKEIAVINSIGESVLDRLSGSDFDSDTALLTDNPILIEAAGRNYSQFKVPVNHVPAVKRKRRYTRAEQADLDVKTSDNKIGDIINLSQELNTILWDRKNHGASYEDIRELYYDICQLDILSGIEIDKAKKEYTTDTYREMQKIKDRWLVRDEDGRMIKPNFFGYLAKAKGYYDSSRKYYLRHDTSMDYLQKIVNQFQSGHRGKNRGDVRLPFSSLLNMEGYQVKNVNYSQVDRVFAAIEACNNSVKAIYSDEYSDRTERHRQALAVRQECYETVGRVRFGRNTILYLLLQLEEEACKKVARTILAILFGYPNSSFYDVLRFSAEPMEVLMEREGGELRLFGFPFTKVLVE